MCISWREQLSQQPSLRQFSNWPVIPIDSVAKEKRNGYMRNQRIVAQVLHGDLSLQQIAQDNHVSNGYVSQLLARCLSCEDDTVPALTKALIPFEVITEKQRQSNLATLAKPSGAACSFKALLQNVPGLHKALDDMIEAKLKDKEYAHSLVKPYDFHGEFKRVLAQQHWPQDTYPYTTKDCAYESVRCYLHQRTDALRQHRLLKKQSSKTFTIKSEVYRAMRNIQIDEHLLHLRGRVHLQLNEELLPLPVSRVSILLAIELATEAILGYQLVFTEHPNQQDLLTLINNCLEPWQPLELKTPGLDYTPGSNFPSALDQPFAISFGETAMDNALMHSAHSVTNLLCHHMGATRGLGLPGQPEIRQKVETMFKYINQQFSHRVASTTGSHPHDPKKETRKNQKKTPLITLETVNEILSVILSEYNTKGIPRLGVASPLELFQHHCAHHYIRYTPRFLSQQWQPFINSQEVALHWYTHQNRSPHINFYYASYKGPGLTEVAGKAKNIRIQYDRRDIRKIKAYSLEGEALGELLVSRPWRRFAHTIATRQHLHQLINQQRLNALDPLAEYFRCLLDDKGKPKTALSLMQVYDEFTYGLSGPLILPEYQQDSASFNQQHNVRSHSWDTHMANHRE